MHLAGCQSLLDRQLALLMFVALSRSFRVSGVHVDYSQQANEEVSSLTLSRTRAVLQCSFLLFFFSDSEKLSWIIFFVFFQGTCAAVYLHSILVFSLFPFGAHERLCCFRFLHFLSTNIPRKILTNPPKRPGAIHVFAAKLQRTTAFSSHLCSPSACSLRILTIPVMDTLIATAILDGTEAQQSNTKIQPKCSAYTGF